MPAARTVGAFVDWLVSESGWPVRAEGTSSRARAPYVRPVPALFDFGVDLTRAYVRVSNSRHAASAGRSKSFHHREEVERSAPR